MSTKLKMYIGRKIVESVGKPLKNLNWPQLQGLIYIGTPEEKSKIELSVPLNLLETNLGITNVNEIVKIQPDDIIRNVSLVKDRTNRKVTFEIDRNIFIKDVMENCYLPTLNYQPQNLVIEFSSPNVAKPFHYGHLRSTIIGSFLSNLNKFLKNNVTKLNYLGDWGTQFGYLRVGIKSMNYTLDNLKSDPIKMLYKCYVHATKLGETNPLINHQAKNEFLKLENGSQVDLDWWKTIVNFTQQELSETYQRLGITFDEYAYESMYSTHQILNVIEILRNKNLLVKKSEKECIELDNDRTVPLIKSDGTSLYLTRDIAAAIDRFDKYKFDKMYYVVENGQSDHFNALKSILSKMELNWATKISHVKFGRIRGMSTRKGTAVFLKDILDEARELVVQRQIQSPTTKVPITDGHTSDVLGISCVIVNDLKQRRQKDYEFDWDRILQVKGDTGIKLQYTHCRLNSLEENCGIMPATACNPDLIREDEAMSLMREMAKFHEVLYFANEQLEACLLVTYLFHLCNHISRALMRLKVKGAEPEQASQRLLLFNTAREVLRSGMIILGLNPLTKM